MSYGPSPYPGPRYAESPVRPPLPQTVQIAFYLMLVGAALQVLGFIITVVRISALRDQLRRQLIDSGSTPSESSLDALVTVVIAVAGAFALIGVGLWIWMAFANRAGRHWARITGTVFFGLYTLSTLSGLLVLATNGSRQYSVGSSTPANFAISAITWVIGLAIVLLIWNRASSAYYRPPYAPAPYAQPQAGYPYGQSAQAVQPQGSPYPVQAPPPAPIQPPDGAEQQGTNPPSTPPNWQNPA
ncbi:hypothetical protein [Actinomadura gamaensis]|uniref:Uncharacterized protein n=1 Tax=Actinomadura gamaensis TaxID=1763541 RepID=A0ABV9U5P5_9ACTN